MPGSKTPAVSKPDFKSSRSLEERVLRILEKADPKTVKEIVDTISREQPLLVEEVKEVTDVVRRLNEKGKIQLIDMSLDQTVKPETSAGDTGIRHENIWLYLVLGTSIATFAVVPFLTPGDVFVPIRWILGTLLVIFLPGYATVQALFPTRNLDTIERYAFSFALSLAIVPLVAFIFNYTPWGVRLDPVVATLVLYTMWVALIASHRKRRRGRNQ